MRRDELEADLDRREVRRQAEPLEHPRGVAGDLQLGDGDGRARVVGGVRAGLVPLHEVGQLRVVDQTLHADLAPGVGDAVGASPVARHARSSEPGLGAGEVVDRDDPAEPAAALLGAVAHRLAEGRLVRRRVVEHLDDLDVEVLGQGQDHVAGAEARVHPAVDRPHTECLAEAVGRGDGPVGLRGIGHMINAHGVMVAQGDGPQGIRLRDGELPSLPAAAGRPRR
ncbi:hypothetical protein GCM10025862_32400 [Arsenicicoccus piscis]|uniref:Uncharacterized protein n=1 Tax=Arsenicicoccus piscis TaxID=673954 RepID=A0ABQ6HRZ2_9MICO|nr:hypothetical protein GCM10025862_32400 [Arsenicicoccus piscis]